MLERRKKKEPRAAIDNIYNNAIVVLRYRPKYTACSTAYIRKKIYCYRELKTQFRYNTKL